MDDKATAAKIVADHMNSVCETSMESAIVAALEAARRDAGAATQRTIDAAFREGYEAALRAHADTLNARNEACNVKGIIDCTGEVPCVRRVLGTLPVTADGVVVGTKARAYWMNGAGHIHVIITRDVVACVNGLNIQPLYLYGSRAAAESAMEGGKA